MTTLTTNKQSVQLRGVQAPTVAIKATPLLSIKLTSSGPQGPKGDAGIGLPGPQGPAGDNVVNYYSDADLPDFTLIFANKLI